jgi:ankyrin repeat protein
VCCFFPVLACEAQNARVKWLAGENAETSIQPLHHAAVRGYVEAMRLLLEAGAGKNASNIREGMSMDVPNAFSRVKGSS